MIEINLLDWRTPLKKRRKTIFTIQVASSLTCLFITSAIAHISLNNAIAKQQNRNQAVQAVIDDIAEKITHSKNEQQQILRLQNQLQLLHNLNTQQTATLKLLNEIAQTLPEQASISLLKQQDDLIQLDGISPSSADVATHLAQLAKSAVISEPKLLRISQNPHANNVSFSLAVRYKNSTMNNENTSP